MWNEDALRSVILRALEEDIPCEDLTTTTIVETDRIAFALLVAKETGVLCGLEIARRVFEILDPSVTFETMVSDGQEIKEGQTLARLRGNARALLMGERTALNFLQHLSGVASLTRKFVEKARLFNVVITDTRKTLPGLRLLEKYAVRCGGGKNHRFSLSDAVLIKENHIRLAGSIRRAVELARQNLYPPRAVEVEVSNLSDLSEALECQVEAILLDNMDLELLRRSVQLVDRTCRQRAIRRPVLEASGRVSVETVTLIAETGVDAISIGALTHSAPALDISMEIFLLPPRQEEKTGAVRREKTRRTEAEKSERDS